MAGLKIVVVGAGGHALVIADAVRACGDSVVGLVDMVSPGRKGAYVYGVPVLGGLDELRKLRMREDVRVALGFGHCAGRRRLSDELSACSVPLHTVVHPRATVSPSAELGAGVYVGPMAVVEAKVCLGVGAIINSGACVCHECQIGAAVAICPGVMIGGRTSVGECSWIGIGASCVDKISIGVRCFIGAGATVVGDVRDGMLALGTPAREVRSVILEF